MKYGQCENSVSFSKKNIHNYVGSACGMRVLSSLA